LALLSIAVYKQVFQDKNFSAVIEIFKKEFNTAPGYSRGLIIVMFLMLINWGLDAVKWKRLMSGLKKISFFQSFKAVLCGVTFSVFTPNRIGEYVGRIFYIERLPPLKAIALTLIGSFSQVLITIIIGTVGFCVFTIIYFEWDLYINYLNFFVAGLLIALLLITYFNVRLFEDLLNKVSFLKRFKKYVSIFSSLSYNELLKLLGLSFLRYAVFTAQYLLLLLMFGIEFSIMEGLMMIGLIFFVQTIIPTIALVELGVRGGVSIFFLSYLTDNTLGILSASYSLWLINLVLPAIIGAGLIFRINFFK